jgi:hypothetical protein
VDFRPLRRNQKHCRPSCRRLALERRRELPLLEPEELCRTPFE